MFVEVAGCSRTARAQGASIARTGLASFARSNVSLRSTPNPAPATPFLGCTGLLVVRRSVILVTHPGRLEGRLKLGMPDRVVVVEIDGHFVS